MWSSPKYIAIWKEQDEALHFGVSYFQTKPIYWKLQASKKTFCDTLLEWMVSSLVSQQCKPCPIISASVLPKYCLFSSSHTQDSGSNKSNPSKQFLIHYIDRVVCSCCLDGLQRIHQTIVTIYLLSHYSLAKAIYGQIHIYTYILWNHKVSQSLSSSFAGPSNMMPCTAAGLGWGSQRWEWSGSRLEPFDCGQSSLCRGRPSNWGSLEPFWSLQLQQVTTDLVAVQFEGKQPLRERSEVFSVLRYQCWFQSQYIYIYPCMYNIYIYVYTYIYIYTYYAKRTG